MHYFYVKRFTFLDVHATFLFFGGGGGGGGVYFVHGCVCAYDSAKWLLV